MVQEPSIFQSNFVYLKPNLSPYPHMQTKWVGEYLDLIKNKVSNLGYWEG